MLSIAAVWPCAGGGGSLVFNFPVSTCFFFLGLLFSAYGPAQAVPVALALTFLVPPGLGMGFRV